MFLSRERERYSNVHDSEQVAIQSVINLTAIANVQLI